ncbi:hypothetical protein B7494_g4683 [Chlorociboria aeruginascens]|nr:hypothetical protein B7494_g4683 [Chlorociboria aeruginascens]
MPHSEHGEDSALEPIAIVGMGGVDSASSLWELLEKKGSGQTPKVPASRFNIDAHLHDNPERPGSFNIPGGYFLDQPVENFDPTFFNVTPVEATWMDPQQRKMLEVAYECLESAGLSLDAVAGSNTAVFVGSFTSDYQQMSIRDTDFRHNYAATGVDPGIISNRIGNTFNLNGPSFTINTACSSSIYAIHNACNALRARDCVAAITGGVNLIITVDQHMNTAKLGILSPTSTCHTFDASADGYGRAEGAGALYLKRLSDAIKDGDPIRGVIRSSAVNTNGKVPGMGITHPSKKGQERVVRSAYEKARLDPTRTAYLECHGTGTPVGDPIESHAVSNAMNDTRSKDKPLLIGAIKANIGHSEAASGIFAVMKAAMMTEAAVIPGVAGFKTLNPAIDEKGWNIKVQRDTVPWPKEFAERRASVSSFGYGGTNGHVIVEGVDSLFPFYSHGKPKSKAEYDHSTTRPLLVGFSAHDKTTLNRNITAHAKVADQFYLADLAYTLNKRRSKFTQNAFTIATEGNEPENFALASFKYGASSKKTPQLGFIFTGQGAQWAGMGAEAMEIFPSFLATIEALDQVLQQLDNAPVWKIKAALLEPASSSRVNEAEISQPLCTAVQIAIVDLFARWNINPTVTVGHSSGEIGAAYAAGLISAPEAITAAFYRGYAVKHNAPVGTMLAVGLGQADVEKYIVGQGDGVVIACENSPTSVTLSGTSEAILAAKARLDEDSIFARELKTGKAYHSPQMSAVSTAYDVLLANAVHKLDIDSLEWRQPRARFFSSVTGEEFFGDTISAAYWSENLRSRVRFDSAVTALAKAAGLEYVTTIIEIGPHSALNGPFKQICQANGFERFTYVPSFVRKEDSAIQLLKVAGTLFNQDYPLDLEEVNSTEGAVFSRSGIKNRKPSILVDLPPYQWNYEKTYWAEPRFSAEQRHMKHGRHDLLGRKVVGLSDRSLVWRNMIRHKDVPWLKDHSLGGDAVFPAAAHLSLAIEAVRQVFEDSGEEVNGITFRDVAIKVALIIPETDDGIEVQLRLTELANKENSAPWYSFAVESVNEGKWSLHCEGTLSPNYNVESTLADLVHPVDITKLTQRVPGKRWYDAFHRVGFQYGPTFQPLANIRTDSKYYDAAADVKIATESGLMVGESRYILHPSTIDACLQLIIVSINAGKHKEMPHGVVPIGIEEMSLWLPGEEAGTSGSAVAWTDQREGRYFNTHTKLTTPSGKLILDIKSLRCVAYEAAVPQQLHAPRSREPYMETTWKPDITSLGAGQAIKVYPAIAESSIAAVGTIVELLTHKKPVTSVTLLAQKDAASLQAVLKAVPSTTSITLAGRSEDHIANLTSGLDLPENFSTIVTSEELFNFGEIGVKEQDLIVIEVGSQKSTEELLTGVKAIAAENGKVVFSVPSASEHDFIKKLIPSGFSAPQLLFPYQESTIILSSSIAAYTNGVTNMKPLVTLLYSNGLPSVLARIAEILRGTNCDVQIQDIASFETFTPAKNEKVIIYDVEGTLLSTLTSEVFDTLKTILTSSAPIIWVSAGVNEGKSISGAMSQGFLRAIRSEQAAAKILLLDVDTSEDAQIVSSTIMGKLDQIATKDSGAETEFWLHDRIVNIARVIPNIPLNDQFSADLSPAEETLLPAEKALQGKISEGELVFRGKTIESQVELTDYEIDLQIEYAELEKKDLQAQSTGPKIVTGKLLAIGKSLDPAIIGLEGVAYTTDSFATIVRIPGYIGDCYNDFKGADLVATLPSLVKAVNAVEVAKITDKEHLLLLPAALAIVDAVAGLKKALGFRLTIVVDTEADKKDIVSKFEIASGEILLSSDTKTIRALMESKSGVAPDVVLAHDFANLSQDVWRFIPAMARFVLSDAAIEDALDALPFTKGASFYSTGVDTLYKRNPLALGDLLKRTLTLLREHKDLIKTPQVHPVSALKDITAFSSTVTSLDNAVLSYRYGESLVKVQPSSKELRFLPDASYLLVGCLGGLGRSLTTWMMAKGAKNFVFLSRSGADKPEAAAVVDSIMKVGAIAKVFRADASNEKDVASVVNSVGTVNPIRGVVHAAMVLQDGIYNGMSYDQFNAAVVPKAKGAQALHNALQGTELDFFVMTSSISATLGNPGQTNYCAANSYLDALAYNRNLNGLAATSLILPMVLDVGVVSENENIELALSKKAMYGIDEAEMLRGFETAMLQPVPKSGVPVTIGKAQVILGLEPAYLAAAVASVDISDAYWYNDARFSVLRVAVEDARKTSESGRSGGGDFAGLLKAAQAEGIEAVLQAVATHIIKKLSSMLMMTPDSFEFDGSSVADYGLDSMIGAELRNWLFKEFAMDMGFQQLLAPKMTIKALSIAIAEDLGLMAEATTMISPHEGYDIPISSWLIAGLLIQTELLIVPVTDNTLLPSSNLTHSWTINQYTPALPAAKMLWYRSHYLPSPSTHASPLASPLLFPSHPSSSPLSWAHLPNALIVVGELDVLRDEGIDYGKKLEEAGREVDTRIMKGMPHPFLAMDGVLRQGKETIDGMVGALRRCFET